MKLNIKLDDETVLKLSEKVCKTIFLVSCVNILG